MKQSNPLHSHAAHPKRSVSTNNNDLCSLNPPSHNLSIESPLINGLLEDLDDVIFDAVKGDLSALEKARDLWPQVLKTIGWELVEESREQYLRYATDVARNSEQIPQHNPDHAVSAQEVISLLMKD